jgi:hypothetical protein
LPENAAYSFYYGKKKVYCYTPEGDTVGFLFTLLDRNSHSGILIAMD